MYLILPRLPKLASQRELYVFASSLLRRKFRIPFSKPPKLHSCMILIVTEQHGGSENHGKLCIEPDSAAKWFMQHVKGHTLYKKKLFAREFVTRTSSEETLLMGQENERRRPGLKTKRLKKVEQTVVAKESVWRERVLGKRWRRG